MATFGKRLREARTLAELTQDKLGDVCGVSRNAVSRWESDTDMPGPDKLPAIARAVRETVDYLLTGRGRKTSKGSEDQIPGIPVVGTAQLGDDGYWLELEHPVGTGEGFVPYPTRDPNTYALRVKGDSMRPRIKPGEFVVIEPNHAVTSGDEVMVQTKDGRSMVKILGHKRRRHVRTVIDQRGHEADLSGRKERAEDSLRRRDHQGQPVLRENMNGVSMTQMDLPVIPHAVEGKLIHQRASDGYINATAMCNAAGKQIGHYFAIKNTKEFLLELSADTHMPHNLLVQIMQGGNPALQGTWVHPQVAINLGQWLSPKFAVQVAKWVYEWMSGSASPEAKKTLPAHIQRYMANRGNIPVTHFSILNEITFALIAPLEIDGYTLPENMVPDISEGRMFSEWLRKEKGVEPKTFPTYKHHYADGRVVDARLYPNELLAEFRKHFHEEWLPKKSTAYFTDRDVKALAYLPKLLPPPVK